MRLLPFYSQHADDVPSEWRHRACGIIALRMALAARGIEATPAELIEEGVAQGAYDPRFGWRHDGLVALAKSRGIEAHRQEFKNNVEQGITELREALARGQTPIVSLRIEGLKDTHLVALASTGEQGGIAGFYYNDPALDAETGTTIFISDSDFLRRWRALAIFVG